MCMCRYVMYEYVRLYVIIFACLCRDDSHLVGVEAIRALAGYFPQRNAKLSLDGSAANDDTSDLRMRSKAWSVSA